MHVCIRAYGYTVDVIVSTVKRLDTGDACMCSCRVLHITKGTVCEDVSMYE